MKLQTNSPSTFITVLLSMALFLGCSKSTNEVEDVMEVDNASDLADVDTADYSGEDHEPQEPEEALPSHEIVTGDRDSKEIRNIVTEPGTGRRVWFVKDRELIVRDQPSNEGKMVRKLSKGDHILAAVEGGWAKISENQYAPVNSLSQEPVKKAKPEGQWSH